MSLRLQAAADLRAILEDVNGFGWAITVTDPSGAVASLTGNSSDIHMMVDPETGQLISGRSASVVLPIAALLALGMDIPKGVADSGRRPWTVRFNDIHGAEHAFKVAEAMPDRTVGAVVCKLEAYIP